MGTRPFHIFTRSGDARAELEEVLNGLGGEASEAVGFHKTIHVSRANQTVVFVTGRDTPLAAALRGRKGWQEPEE